MKNGSIIILAAGQGSRMKSSKAKVLHKISGKSMLYYSIKESLNLSDDISVVLYHQANKIKEEIQNEFKENLHKINFIIQDYENFPGTGGAIMNVKPKYEKTLVLNADMPLISSLELEKFYKVLKKDTCIVMAVLDLKDANGYGRVIIKDEKIVKIVEQKDAKSDELKINTANAGVYLFNTKFLQENLKNLSNKNAQKEYYITDLIELAIKQEKEVKPLFVFEENFKGVNSKLDLAKAEELHQNRIKEKFMLEGVQMRFPQSIYIEESVEIQGECFIEQGVSLLGKTKIINSHIKTNSVIEDSVIIKSDIGPMARIRPNSELENTHIGNFVETKKAKLKGVKAGHLSYLGDCTIDEGTNIGCGSITCNYDGISKYETIIGKNVFVGSNTKFIAPVELEDNTMVAAGSTVTSKVRQGQLYINRANKRQIDGYYFKHFKQEHKEN